MATTNTTQMHPLPDDPQRIERVNLAERRTALGMLLTGRNDPDDPSVDQFLAFMHGQNLPLNDLWATYRGTQPVAATLIVPSPGRTAMAFLSPIRGSDPSDPAIELIRVAASNTDPQRVRLIQALVDPHQTRQQKIFADAGFSRLAELVYMHHRVTGQPRPFVVGDPDITTSHWSEAERPLFERTILATYEDTMDCPGLLGLRDVADILEGHMAAGTFHPEWWTLMHDRGEPVAVMLLSEVAARESVELVYLGIAPKWRGKGLGKQLVQQAVATAAAHRASQVLLAVDQNNKPAMHLYRSLGFQSTGRKCAMIYDTHGPSNS